MRVGPLRGDGDGDSAAASPAGPAGTGPLPVAEPQHGTASSLATQQIPHLNAGQPVSCVRAHFFKARSALQSKGKFLRGPWFPHRH